MLKIDPTSAKPSLPEQPDAGSLVDDQPARAKALRFSVVEGSLHAVMVGLSESTLGAFAVELGHGGISLALLSTLPFLIGALTQLVMSEASSRHGKRRPFVVGGAFLQAISHAGFLYIALSGEAGLVPLLVVKTVFWIGGFGAGAPWNAWMCELTTAENRARYFARRSAVVHVFLLLSFFAGALLLDEGRSDGHVLTAFAVVHGVGMLARLLSTVVLAVQYEPPGQAVRTRWKDVSTVVKNGSGTRLLVVMTMFTFGAWVSVPFYTPYMIRVMQMDYTTFASLIAVAIGTKSFAFMAMATISRRVGLLVTLAGGILGIALIPLAWALEPSVTTLIAAQCVSGVAWAAYEYASFQLLLGAADGPGKTTFFSISSLLTGTAQVSGGVAGGRLLDVASGGYPQLFFLSFIGRAIPLLLLFSARFRTALRSVQTHTHMPLKIDSVRPAGGASHRPIVVDK